ncbi:PilZ domain-containing protein [Alkalimonas collagenimarina]|uniref:PilZ domain-containing protein n=1 Tax=Alkalimonas collagenimarina TaxID=400390 RepID=A0ABT9GUV2_9GAMM|nr:PilZ domain-containing protein [Alkalimonas collagenimarina]MDP4534831.1 PilZ domain-containing protein [Alkalimonas collagenimarina]
MKSLVQTSDFDQMFTMLTSDLPKSKQFLLKMELKRLAQPCDYFIDLRGHVDGDVKPFPFQGKTHYMDEQAIKIFEQGIKQYGTFTLGLYEEVMNTDNNYRVMHRKETEQRIRKALNASESELEPEQQAEPTNQHQARFFQFASYINRIEERMNYSITVEVMLDDGKKYSAQTTDISVQGCKLKLAKAIDVELNSNLGIFFRELEQEYTLDRQTPIRYKVLEVSPLDSKYQQLRLKRLDGTSEQDIEFSNFLDKFIRGNKRRYKLNLDNTLDAVVIKGYEQFFVPRMSALAVFVSVHEGKSNPQCVLTTENSRPSFHYFQDELQRSVLPQVLNAKRLKQLLQQPSTQRSSQLFCFTHASKGKLYFYSATAQELAEQPELSALFLGFGASKKSWKVFQLSLQPTSLKFSQLQFQIPGTTAKEQTKGSPHLLDGYLKNLRFIVSMADISSEQSNSWYQQIRFDKAQLSQLNRFAHAKLAKLPFCEAIPVKYVNLRFEARYLYKTTVELFDSAQQALPQSFSRDFSPNGMQIESMLPLHINKGDIVRLNLPDLQKISNKYTLSHLPYEVMAVSKSGTIMNLKALSTDEGHAGKQFFQLLIQNNRSKLTVAEEPVKHPGLAPALRNMYVKALDSFPFYIHRKGIRYDLKAVAAGSQLNSLHLLLQQLNADKEHLIIEPLIKHNAVSLHFANQLKNMKRQDPPTTYELYIQLSDNWQQQPEQGFRCNYDYEFSTEPEKQAFFQQAIASGSLVLAYKIWLSRTGRPDSDYISQELDYISQYAIHKAKMIEEELWSVVGVGELIDITDEVLLRFAIPPEQRAEQHQMRQHRITG